MLNLNTGPNLFDRIQAYYLSNEKLTPKEQEIAERWELAFALLSEHRNKKLAISKYLKILSTKEQSISIAQAYRDMNDCQRVFAPIQAYSKEFLRLMVIDSAIKDIKAAENKASEAGTIPEWNKAMAIKDKAEQRLIKAAGLDDQHPDLPDFSQLEAPAIENHFPPELMSALTNLTNKGVVDITAFLQQNSEDAKIIEDGSTETGI
jgi:hypothetical protein